MRCYLEKQYVEARVAMRHKEQVNKNIVLSKRNVREIRGNWRATSSTRLGNIHVSIVNSDHTKSPYLSLQNSCSYNELVDFDASTHLILQLPCLRHCHSGVHPIQNPSKPKNRLSSWYHGDAKPNHQHVKSGISRHNAHT